jgi:hypothetical protein
MIVEPDDLESVASFDGACSAFFGEQCAEIEKARACATIQGSCKSGFPREFNINLACERVPAESSG